MRARIARNLYHLLGALKAITTQNLIKDNPITVQDINLTIEILVRTSDYSEERLHKQNLHKQ